MQVTAQELITRMKATEDKSEYMKLQTMLLYRVEKRPAAEVAKIVGTTPGMVYQWAYKYGNCDINGFIKKSTGGRMWAFMSLEEEKALLEEVLTDATNGIIVISKIVRQKAEEKLGRSVSADYAEDLLNRHNWRKITPRTKHPKSSKEEQEEFKKKFQILLKKQKIHSIR